MASESRLDSGSEKSVEGYKLRIGIITHNYPRTLADRKDAGILIYDFAQELAKKAKVFVLSPNFVGKKEKYRKVPATWFDWTGGKKKLGDLSFKDPKVLFDFFSLMMSGKRAALEFTRNNKIDFYLACWGLPSGVFAMEAKKTLGTPYATWSLGSDINKYLNYPLLGSLTKKALRRADHRFANSHLLCSKIGDLAGKECEFLPGVTNIKVKKIKNRTLRPEVCNLLFVGRLERDKGLDILIDALSTMGKDKFFLHIAGDGTMRDGLIDKVKRRGLASKVRFYGFLGERDISEMMQKSDCLVIPSRSESLPLVMVESAKLGLPVIATDVGDCKRLINKYAIGLSVPKENPKELAVAIDKFMKNKKTIKKRSRIGLAKMSEDFSQKKAVELFMKQVNMII